MDNVKNAVETKTDMKIFIIMDFTDVEKKRLTWCFGYCESILGTNWSGWEFTAFIEEDGIILSDI